MVIKRNYPIIERILSSFDYVDWDRFVDFEDVKTKVNFIRCFGWIDREKDNYKDFVVIEFNNDKEEFYLIMTSSKKYSKDLHLKCGGKLEEHSDCSRIEYHFNINNVIRLEQKAEE